MIIYDVFKHLWVFLTGLLTCVLSFCLALLLVLTFPIWMAYLAGCYITNTTPPAWVCRILDAIFGD